MSAKVQAIIAAMRGDPAAPPARAKSKGYAHAYTWYAERYGKSLRTIKRWAAEGKPLDDPDAMGEHLSPAGRKPDFQEDPPRSQPPADPAAGAGDELAEQRINRLDESFLAGEGLEGALKRITKIELALADALREQLNKAKLDPQALKNRLSEWASVIEAMRKVEKDAPGIFGDNKKTVDIAHAQQIQFRMLEAFARSLDALPGRAAGKLEGLDYNDRAEVLEREVDVIKRTLSECDYLTAPNEDGA